MASIVLVGIGLYIRVGIEESPAFSKLAARGEISRAPVSDVIKKHPKEIILAALVRTGEQSPFYVFTAFIFAYGTGTLNVSRDLLLSGVLVASAISFVAIPLFGHLSDRFGRRRIYILGAITTGIYAFAYIALLNTGSTTLIFVAIALSLIPHDMMYGPQAALIAEAFPARLRYSGASLGYQLASVFAGGPAPIIATALLASTGSGWSISGYILVCAVISFVAALLMPDLTNKPMPEDTAPNA